MTTPSTSQAATPTAFPPSGTTFAVTQRVTLLSATPEAVIHYTTDGSTPTSTSTVFDPYNLPVLDSVNEGDKGTSATYTIKALAVKADLADSDVAEFTYTINRRGKDEYVVKDIAPGVQMILDFDDTKMYLVKGRDKAVFIDAGLGSGDLRAYVEKLVGDLPLEVVITHAHPDHIALMGQFQGTYNVYMNHIDMPMLLNFVERVSYKIDPEQVIDLREGYVFDLGDRKFAIYEVPGHSAGSVVLFDEASGLLIAGDAVGSNRPTITDSLWMQFPGMSKIDDYLSALQIFRSKIAGKVKLIYGGHNDEPFYGEAYLDNLQAAAQKLVDEGEDILTPSLRPAGVWQVVVGDRLTDPNWAAINVAKGASLSTPAPKIASLSNLQVSSGALNTPFKPNQLNYSVAVDSETITLDITPTATSTRHKALTINGTAHVSGTPYKVSLDAGENTFVIQVTAPDGSVSRSYTLSIVRA